MKMSPDPDPNHTLAADATKSLVGAREVLAKAKLKDGSITAEFARIGKGKVTYSHRQHTKTEAR
jgi:hypothetical protein